MKSDGPWRVQREGLLAEIRRQPNPEEAASLHSAGFSESAVKFVKQQSPFVRKVGGCSYSVIISSYKYT